MSNFKVIIIGAGPTGLTAAHSLSRAGIDFVVLERRPEVVEDVGASLALFPYTLRLLAQFGLYEKVREVGHELLRWADYTNLGKFMESFHPHALRENHGTYPFLIHRADYIQTIYDGLSEQDRARVHTNKKLQSIEDVGDGVVATCTDGSTYEGSIVLGADGVHSQTRTLMRELTLRKSPDADVNDIAPFQHSYKTMWCSFPRRWEFPPGDHCITHGNLASLQLINGRNRAWLFLYEKLEAASTERVDFTEEDMKEFASKHADMKIGDRLRVKDVFPHRTSAGMANLEEGILKHWSSGRIVLAGDAAHKFTPNAGLGYNNAVQDVIVLVNELNRLLNSGDKEVVPSEADLAALFHRYHVARKEGVEEDYLFSWRSTRLCAWPNTGYWLFDQYVIPAIPDFNNLYIKLVGSPTISKVPCLDFIEGEEPFEGKVPWVHKTKKPGN
ncbi:hypothetical protein KVR01_000588 [Diaporthe batatas]|uniref:uncharacterized protein n=1 Tax=Diaporthe batatas TaxID=748121 RepID=UPI001D04A5C8|nr:uncharacterized protein KVR01_000588 [Diaporthe batatas]KAG8169843.1 hypothetical protein KVR01_000588 [Diaporthe batatas]